MHEHLNVICVMIKSSDRQGETFAEWTFLKI